MSIKDQIKDQIQKVQTYVVNEAGSANLPGKENGPYDAYRHLLLAAELTRIYGESAAKLMLIDHEYDNFFEEGQPLNNSVMDWQNNSAR